MGFLFRRVPAAVSGYRVAAFIVFQEIIHRLYHRTLPQQYLARHLHHHVFHVLPQPRDLPDALPIQMFKQPLPDIPTVPEQFPVQFQAQQTNGIQVPSVNLARRKG
jgi:hypothetical protein